MPDLLIRYCNGVRTICIDYAGPKRLEQTLHNKAREQRIPIPPSLAHITLTEWIAELEKRDAD